MGETSIPCREATRNRLDDIRGGRYRSWDEFLNDMADTFEDGDGGVETGDVPEIARSVEAIEERTGRIERTLEDLQR